MKKWYRYPLFGGLIGVAVGATIIATLVFFPVGLPVLALALISGAVGLTTGIMGTLFGQFLGTVQEKKHIAAQREEIKASHLSFAKRHPHLYTGLDRPILRPGVSNSETTAYENCVNIRNRL